MSVKRRTPQSILAEEKFKKKVEEKGGILKSEYKDSKTHVEVICKNKHLFKIAPKHLNSDDQWCKYCPSKKTLEIYGVLIYLVNLYNGTIIGEFTKTTNPIRLQCERGHQWDAIVKVICETTCWCPDCDKMDGITFEDNLKSTIALRDGSLEGIYSGNMNKYLTIICSEGHEFYKKAYDIMKGHWCDQCDTKTTKVTKEKFYKLVSNNGGTVITEYSDTRTKVTLKCAIDHEWSTTPGHILKGSWCPKCPKSASIEAERKFREKVELKGGKIKDGQEYKGIHTHITIICAEEHEFTSEPNSIMSMDSWCPACSNNCPKQAAQNFYNYINSMRGKTHNNYTHAYGDVTIECEFGHTWKICPHFMMAHLSWCPTCNESSGERFTRFTLEKYGIPFTSQKIHPALPKYKFDFHFIYNNKEYYLEYDGEQHFTKVDFFHKTEEDFQNRRYIDICKSRTIHKLGHNLIRLDYSLNTIEKVEKHIISALQSDQSVYYSNPELYSWINLQYVTLNVIKQ